MGSSARVESVENTACAWLLKRDSGQWSHEDEAGLVQWLDEDTGNWVAFHRLQSVWRQTDRMRLLNPGSTPASIPARGTLNQSSFPMREHFAAPSVPPDVSRLRLKRVAAMAAGLLLSITLGAVAYFHYSGGPSYRTAIGGLASVPLEDCSSITQNTNTEVRLAVGARERRVSLIYGEALFEVTHDPKRPFVVDAGGERVMVLGTRFSVRIKPDAMEVKVADGKVRVEEDRFLRNDRPLADLRSGHKAAASGGRIVVEEMPISDLEQTLRWSSGYISFQRTLLGEVVDEFNRYHRRQLVIEDPTVAGIRFSGNFRWNNLDGFLRMLRDGFNIQARTEGDRIVLIREGS